MTDPPFNKGLLRCSYMDFLQLDMLTQQKADVACFDLVR